MPATTAFTLRHLGPEDEPLMRAMLRMFGQAFGEPDTYGDSPPGSAYLRRLLARDSVIALAAVKDEEVVGGLAAYELPKFEQERSELAPCIRSWAFARMSCTSTSQWALARSPAARRSA